MAVNGASAKPGPSAKSGPSASGAVSAPSPHDVAAALGGEMVDPERLRRQVMDALEAPAPTPSDRAEQIERAHALLQEALGADGGASG